MRVAVRHASGSFGSMGSLPASRDERPQLSCSNAAAQRGKQRCSCRPASLARAWDVTGRARHGHRRDPRLQPGRRRSRPERVDAAAGAPPAASERSVIETPFQRMRTTAEQGRRRCEWVALRAAARPGGSAGGCERPEAGAHVGDQLVADAHQRNPSRFWPLCRRRDRGRPTRSRWGCLSERARMGQWERGAPGREFRVGVGQHRHGAAQRDITQGRDAKETRMRCRRACRAPPVGSGA